MKTKINQKPTEIDAHLKYQCPKCGIQHWISYREAKTANFKIVCDCNTVFKPKRVAKIKIIYADNKLSKIQRNKSAIQLDTTTHYSLPVEILTKCSKILVGYGFTQLEAENMLKQTYIKNQTEDCIKLIKYTLESLGVNYNEQHSTNIVQ